MDGSRVQCSSRITSPVDVRATLFPMPTIKNVTVYCSSSTRADASLMEAARDLGTILAAKKLGLVFGGGGVGLMGALFESAHEAGAHTIGITTEQFVTLEQVVPHCDELLIKKTMAERKELLIERGDAILVLAGGLGTYEEFFDAFVGRVLGHHSKPMAIVNTDGIMDPLITLIEDGISRKLISHGVRDYLHVRDTPEAAIEAIMNSPEHFVDPSRMVPSGDWETTS